MISILNQTVEDQDDMIPSDREVSVISSAPNHYHFITKHETDARLIYTNIYFMDKQIKKPNLARSGMVFLESTLLKLLDLYKRSSDVFRSEMEENLDPISCDKRLTVGWLPLTTCLRQSGRGDWIRTSDLSVPNAALQPG